MVSLQENTIENSTVPQAHQTIEDHQIQSVPAPVNNAMGANPNGPQIPRGRDPIVFVPVQAMGSRWHHLTNSLRGDKLDERWNQPAQRTSPKGYTSIQFLPNINTK
jgi:hypothetical protein